MINSSYYCQVTDFPRYIEGNLRKAGATNTVLCIQRNNHFDEIIVRWEQLWDVEEDPHVKYNKDHGGIPASSGNMVFDVGSSFETFGCQLFNLLAILSTYIFYVSCYLSIPLP